VNPTEPADVCVDLNGFVATVTLQRPPNNFIDGKIVGLLADRLEHLDSERSCRAIVLTSGGKHFCAGADFGPVPAGGDRPDSVALYRSAMRLFRTRKPIVAAIQGAAIGAGVGLALVADFRIASTGSRFSVNFNRLGFHPGFGLSYTLPKLIGIQQASLMLYTGRRIDGLHAQKIGLIDELSSPEELLPRATALAQEIADSAPIAVLNTRATLRHGMADDVEAWNRRELEIQLTEFQTRDFREGIEAAAQRRTPVFTGN
jgi:enoyl-CoA hydratase/carnithine racemase